MSTLDAPLTYRCGVTVPQRTALAPLTNTQSNPDGTLHDDELRWLTRRAGGFGLVSTCAAFVSEEGHAWKGQLGVAGEHHRAGLERLATGIRARGSVGIVQLHHGGAKADQAALKLSTVDGDGQRAATADDIERVIHDFVEAARLSEQAGFDGVELHGANGYLFTQFLAPEDNPRTDAYGGSLPNRARLLRRALQAVRAAVSPGFLVGVRLSPVDSWMRRGLVLEDGVQTAVWLAQDGADFIHLSLGDAAGSPPHEDTDLPVARAVRDALPEDVAVHAAGGIWTRADAQRALDAGVDVVVLGRAGIAHPDWTPASKAPAWQPVKPAWSQEYLRSVDVSDRFQRYLSRMAGMVESGAPAHG